MIRAFKRTESEGASKNDSASPEAPMARSESVRRATKPGVLWVGPSRSFAASTTTRERCGYYRSPLAMRERRAVSRRRIVRGYPPGRSPERAPQLSSNLFLKDGQGQAHVCAVSGTELTRRALGLPRAIERDSALEFEPVAAETTSPGERYSVVMVSPDGPGSACLTSPPKLDPLALWITQLPPASSGSSSRYWPGLSRSRRMKRWPRAASGCESAVQVRWLAQRGTLMRDSTCAGSEAIVLQGR
jgi:hypothetical protein